MKNNRGFTLIELLAVIVILAIIALIASPIIVGLIDDARKEAAANSAYGVYHSVENVFSKILLASGGNGLPDEIVYTFGTDGVATPSYGGSATIPAGWNITDADATLDFNGTRPTAGVLQLNPDGSVAINTSLVINGFTCTKDAQNKFTCS